MRSYAPNSPQALARIVGLTMLADGHLSQTEYAILDELHAHQQLGLSREAMSAVLQDLCQDLLATGHHHWHGALHIEPRTLSALLAEVTEPELQATVLTLCMAVADADPEVSDGESLILDAALTQWRPNPPVVAAAAARFDQLDLPVSSTV